MESSNKYQRRGGGMGDLRCWRQITTAGTLAMLSFYVRTSLDARPLSQSSIALESRGRSQ